MGDQAALVKEEPARPERVDWVLVFLVRRGRLLLGTRLVEPGLGFCSGFGGWVEPEETAAEAARRETAEEAAIVLRDLEEAGSIEFAAEEASQRGILARIFWSSRFDGEPRATEESAPAWYKAEDLPHSAMWPADECWVPFFLAGFRVAVWVMRTDETASPKALVVVRGDKNPRLVESLRLE